MLPVPERDLFVSPVLIGDAGFATTALENLPGKDRSCRLVHNL